MPQEPSPFCTSLSTLFSAWEEGVREMEEAFLEYREGGEEANSKFLAVRSDAENTKQEYFREKNKTATYQDEEIRACDREVLRRIEDIVGEKYTRFRAEKGAITYLGMADLLLEHNTPDLWWLIKYLSELRELDMHDNAIPEIDISKNSKLIYLNCSNTQISHLETAQNSRLEMILCSNNLMSELDLTKNINLKTLHAISCKNLSNIYFPKQNILLEEIGISKTIIAELDLSHLPMLSVLYCSNTKIKVLDLSNNLEIRTLSCINSEYLQTITFPPNLTQLKSIRIPNCPNLDEQTVKSIRKLDQQGVHVYW